MNDPAYPPSQPSSNKNKWVLFGCGGCLGLLVIGAIAGFFLVSTVFKTLKESDAYKEAMQRAQASPAVQEALGTPIEDTFFVGGSISIENGNGEAHFAAPLKGSKTQGVLNVNATKSGGIWQFHTLNVVVPATNQVIELLEGAELPVPSGEVPAPQEEPEPTPEPELEPAHQQ